MVTLKAAVLSSAVGLSAFVVLPYIVLTLARGFLSFDSGPIRWLGLAPLAAGLALAGWTVMVFVTIGRGTPAPFDPPKKLVDVGPFRRVRNPMSLER